MLIQLAGNDIPGNMPIQALNLFVVAPLQELLVLGDDAIPLVFNVGEYI